jgi:DNA-binding NarL/FixJ family response regulator
MLVCAPAPEQDGVRVSLADGVYDTVDDRVFWQEVPEREVMRLPRDLPVAVRQLRTFPRQRAAMVADGEAALLAAIRESRAHVAAPREEVPPSVAGSRELTEALIAGDTDLAAAHAMVLWRQAGLNAVYDVMSQCLAQLAASWAEGRGTVHAEHRATRAAREVTARLAALTPAPQRMGTVLLAVPEGEQHSLALEALAHLLRDKGWPVQVLDALPPTELAHLAAATGAVALVMSLHTAVSAPDLTSLMTKVRQSAPGILLVLGGPAAQPRRSASTGADLVTQSVTELLERLEEAASILTERECQVLTAVAAGHTTSAIAELLGVAPSTVKSHLDNIFSKTGTEHRAAAVACGLRRGWIT